MQATEYLLKLFFFGNVGLVIEVWFTSLHAVIIEKDTRAPGRTYLWMWVVYGAGGIALGFLHSFLQSKWLFVPTATLFIYLAEFSSGWLLRKILGRCPWDYGAARFGIAGLIRLDYLPFWLMVAVGYDLLVDMLDKVLRFAGSLA